jgi:LacI family transcriptional regulator
MRLIMIGRAVPPPPAMAPSTHLLPVASKALASSATAAASPPEVHQWVTSRSARTEPRDPRVAYLHERGFPFATHGRTEMGLVHPYFDFDNERYAEVAVDRLVRCGRKRLALLAPPTRYTYARHMNAGFQRGVERNDVTDVPLRTIDTDSSEAEIHAEISRVMAGPRYPDGFVCGSAQAAITVVVAAESAGRVIGRDFDVAVKESFGLMKKFRAPIEVVHENFRSAGASLAHAVLSTIEGAPPDGLQTLEVPEEDVASQVAPIGGLGRPAPA